MPTRVKLQEDHPTRQRKLFVILLLGAKKILETILKLKRENGKGTTETYHTNSDTKYVFATKHNSLPFGPIVFLTLP